MVFTCTAKPNIMLYVAQIKAKDVKAKVDQSPSLLRVNNVGETDATSQYYVLMFK